MSDIFDQLSKDSRSRLEKVQQPEWLEPMLATLTDERFSDKNWIFERKLDGERCITYRKGTQLDMMSRNRKSLNAHYPELVDALQKQDQQQFIVDGEVVAFKGRITSFSKLQERMHVEDPGEALETGVKVFYYIFDVLYLDGYDVTNVNQRQRKVLLKSAFNFDDPLRYVSHRNTQGEDYFEQACQKGWEGIIAKDAESAYVHSRSKNWLKFKCVHRQELVVGGFTDPHGERIGFGALLVGYYERGDLLYAGKVGTGFDDETLRRLSEKLAGMEIEGPAFTADDLPSKEVHWVEPDLVAQIGFEEWTEDGKLRQPRFQGLREDKDPEDVVKEDVR